VPDHRRERALRPLPEEREPDRRGQDAEAEAQELGQAELGPAEEERQVPEPPGRKEQQGRGQAPVALEHPRQQVAPPARLLAERLEYRADQQEVQHRVERAEAALGERGQRGRRAGLERDDPGRQGQERDRRQQGEAPASAAEPPFREAPPEGRDRHGTPGALQHDPGRDEGPEGAHCLPGVGQPQVDEATLLGGERQDRDPGPEVGQGDVGQQGALFHPLRLARTGNGVTIGRCTVQDPVKPTDTAEHLSGNLGTWKVSTSW